MSKKMIKRGLVLSALMAMVITGNAFAATPLYNEATADQAIAVGPGAQAAATSVAIGRLSNAAAESSVAIGVNNTANGKHAVAMGYYANAKADNAVAIGDNVTAEINSVSIGVKSDAAKLATAIGSSLKATGERSIAIGSGSSATGFTGIAIGFETNSVGTGSVAIGLRSNATDESTTAMGYGADATGNRASAYGANAKAIGLRSTALGYSASANNDFDVAVGSHSETVGTVNVASVEIGGETYTFAGSEATGAVSFGGGGSSSLGISNIKRQLQNVAAGQVDGTSTDAVNGSQLYAAYQAIDVEAAKRAEVDGQLGNAIVSEKERAQLVDGQLSQAITNNSEAISGINNRLDRTNTRLDKVGAGAAALAALHPLEYDPDDKFTFSVGMGNYSGENAAAIGAFYRPNEKLMFSLGGSMGNGENMVNLGMSIGLDKANGLAKLSKRELIQKVNAVENENDILADRVAKLEAMVAQLIAK